MVNPTKEIYSALEQAYDYFNSELFAGKLPHCAIVMHRKKGAAGYFWQDQWTDGTQNADEIALNPDVMSGRTITETLSTLVHEMAHLEQAHFGKPSRNGYHNKEWANMMIAVGLTPYNVKEPEKQTGQSCSHTIEENGVFEVSCANLMASGFVLDWGTTPAAKKGKKAKNKVKYECQECGAAVWGKPDLNVSCGDCEIQMEEA